MVTPSDVPRRRNGLSGPYSIPQISSWIFLSATSLQFLIFISTILPLEISIPLTIFFFSLVGLVLYFGMRAIAIDSMDVYLCKTLIEQQNTENGELFRRESKFLNRAYTLFNGDVETIKNQQFPENEETKQCWICDTQVAHHSMHCKYCNKCVSHFDHHCLCKNIKQTKKRLMADRFFCRTPDAQETDAILQYSICVCSAPWFLSQPY